MLIKVPSISMFGLEALNVVVEVDISSRGMPYFDVIGLPSKAVAESKHRVRTALQNSGFAVPDKRIIVNLAPADIPKEGSFYDFPIAVGIICGVLDINLPSDALFFGELSLDGSLRYSKGAFILGLYAKEHGFSNIYIPAACVSEVAFHSNLSINPVPSLKAFIQHIKNGVPFDKINAKSVSLANGSPNEANVSIDSILGQEQAKRALEISAAGGHNLIMIGPPGAGKTMLAKSIVSILPPLDYAESLEVTKIHSVCSNLPSGSSLITKRPFRSPHHTVSYAGIVGGGSIPKPGEISLAHHGILFMDEFPEFSRPVLEALRQPMEDAHITISRSMGSVKFPANFTLLAASNPCPCGFLGHSITPCTCSPKQISSYKRRLSGPILDRIDMHVSIKPVDLSGVTYIPNHNKDKSGLAESCSKVLGAKARQIKRFSGSQIMNNADMTNTHLGLYCPLDSKCLAILAKAATKLNFSARSYFKIIRLARTIADLSGVDLISDAHILEAIQYRFKFEPISSPNFC